MSNDKIHPDFYQVNMERIKTGIKGETSKAHARRLSEGWYDKFVTPEYVGLDIGCSDDPLNQTFRRWDLAFGDGDATYLEGVPPCSFYTVYASHVLEHIQYPREAIARWYRVTAVGGHLIICVPHRDLYEKKMMLPSRWNPDHKHFWLPETAEPPCTKSLRGEVLAAVPNANIVSLRVLDDGYDNSLGPKEHPTGEYSIECVIRREL